MYVCCSQRHIRHHRLKGAQLSDNFHRSCDPSVVDTYIRHVDEALIEAEGAKAKSAMRSESARGRRELRRGCLKGRHIASDHQSFNCPIRNLQIVVSPEALQVTFGKNVTLQIETTADTPFAPPRYKPRVSARTILINCLPVETLDINTARCVLGYLNHHTSSHCCDIDLDDVACIIHDSLRSTTRRVAVVKSM